MGFEGSCFLELNMEDLKRYLLNVIFHTLTAIPTETQLGILLFIIIDASLSFFVFYDLIILILYFTVKGRQRYFRSDEKQKS